MGCLTAPSKPIRSQTLSSLNSVRGTPRYSKTITPARFKRRAISGEIAQARGQRREAVLAFEQAVRIQDGLNFNEPPDWPQSMRLYLGAALLKAGRAKDAEVVYREELRDLHDNGWALFGLWQSARAQGRTVEAEKIRERFDRAWKNADVVLTSSIF